MNDHQTAEPAIDPACALDPAPVMRPIVACDEPLEPRPKAIYVQMGGRIDVESADGTRIEGIQVYPGRNLVFVPHKITATHMSAKLVGLY